jgi:hypothetical protein
MKIQIDTDRKTVEVLENINLALLVKALKVMLGNDYDQYTFINDHFKYHTYTWTSPIVVPYIPSSPYPYTWPPMTCSTGTHNIDIQSGMILDSKVDSRV